LNKNIEIELQLINDNATVPSRKHDSDIGYDISASIDVLIRCKEVQLINTGIAINLPNQCAGFVLPRSGLASKHKITLINSPGLVDPGYTGELMVPLINHGSSEYQINIGDRIAQLVLINTNSVEFKIVKNLPDTDRSAGGFGSTD
jgi:dUTP pyrophosphatase